MFDKLGIVTNCLARRLSANESFEQHVENFVQNGFTHIEIRDGKYLRESEFGKILQGIETAMQHYTNAEWQRLCMALRHFAPQDAPGIRTQDLPPMEGSYRLLHLPPKTTYSYAIAHHWMRRPEEAADDDASISRAKKLAYLLSPTHARLRLVDLNVKEPVDETTAMLNLQRYRSLTPECPVTLTVENSGLPPHLILDLAVKSDVFLAYDEANNFRQDGTTIGDTEAFWGRVETGQLVSVHLKQKSSRGVRACLKDGFVDFPVLVNRLSNLSYDGDWLLEYRATDQPLQDAIDSRKYLFATLESAYGG